MLYSKKSSEHQKQHLIKLINENNITDIENLIKNNKHLLFENYGPFHSTILHIACYNEEDKITANTVATLIKCGADLYRNDVLGRKPFHTAAIGLNPDILKIFLSHCDVNITDQAGNTALTDIIKHAQFSNPNLKECIDILLNSGIDVNKLDKKKCSAIYWAAAYKYKSIVELLLQCDDINLDTNSSEGVTARTLITKLGISTIHIPNKNLIFMDKFEKLQHYLNSANEEDFIKLASKTSCTDQRNQNKTLLQLACENNLLASVKHLLEQGVDPNFTTEKYNLRPVEIAASNGYAEILDALLDQSSITDVDKPFQSVLSELHYCTKPNYMECYEILMRKKGHCLNVNSKNHSGYFPLHYGSKHNNIAADLLKKGASLANKNILDDLTISEINYEVLKEHFDNCIEEEVYHEIGADDTLVTYNYKTLLPTIERKLNEEEDQISTLVPEMEVIFYISKTPQLKMLLKHPLITSFLYIKWYPLQWIFYASLLFYLSFCLSLLLHVGVYYNDTSFSKRYKFNFIFLVIMTFVLLFKEILEMLVVPKKYFMNFENYLEMTLIIIVLFMPFSEHDVKTKKQLYAVVILLAAFKLLFFLGNIPHLSTYVIMLRVISLNFFKFLSFYSILILAFAFCFHVLFEINVSHDVQNIYNASQSAPEFQQNFFGNYYTSVFKTIIMLSGELEASQIGFHQFPITSHLIFLMFIITMAIILLNLLNGLAISDTQKIKNEAELYGLTARVAYMANAESMIFGNIVGSKFKDIFYKLFSCKSWAPTWIYKRLARRLSLNINFLRDYKLVVDMRRRWIVRQKKFCKCFKIHLDRRTIWNTKCLIRRKVENEKAMKQKSNMKKVEDGIFKIVNYLEVSDKIEIQNELLRKVSCLEDEIKEIVNQMDVLKTILQKVNNLENIVKT